MGAVVRRGRPPAHFWFLFVRAKRNSPPGETWHTVSFGAVKRNGVGKLVSQRRQPLDAPKDAVLETAKGGALVVAPESWKKKFCGI